MTAPTTTPSKEISEADEQSFKTIYFGFASNLSPRSLQQRCPGSIYIGLAKLKGWRFIISETGFGNIVPGTDDDEVYGSLHFFTAKHEAALDRSEEVPKWHLKKHFSVTRVAATDLPFPEGETLEVMTYVDVERVTEGVMSKEYIFLVRKAISDGVKIGVPKEYFERYWKKFLPEDETVGHEDQVIMQRTVLMDKEDLRYVPKGFIKGDS